jgi:hypothetical protein
MSIWGGMCRHLRFSAPQVIRADARAFVGQRRYWSPAASRRKIHAAGDLISPGCSGAGGLRWNNTQIPYQIHDNVRARRRFSETRVAEHGHIEPPKPGEECVNFRFRETRTNFTEMKFGAHGHQDQCDFHRQGRRETPFPSRRRRQSARHRPGQ